MSDWKISLSLVYSGPSSNHGLAIDRQSFMACCSHYSDFFHTTLTRLLSQGYQVNCLSNTFKKLYGTHTNQIGQDKKNVAQMFSNSMN